MNEAKLLLEKLTERIPPGKCQKHNITLDDGGKLFVTLMLGDRYVPFSFDEADLNLSVSELVDNICFLLQVK